MSLASESEHLNEQLAVVACRLADAQAEVVRLSEEHRSLATRRDHVSTLLEQLAALEGGGGGGGGGDARLALPDATRTMSAPPAPCGGSGGRGSSASSNGSGIGGAPLAFGRQMNRPGRVRTVAVS